MEIVSTVEGFEMNIHIHIPLRKLVTGACLVAFSASLYFSAQSQIGRVSKAEVRQEVSFGQPGGTETMEMVTKDGSRKFSLLLGRLRCVPQIPDVSTVKLRRENLRTGAEAEKTADPVIPDTSAGVAERTTPPAAMDMPDTAVTDTEAKNQPSVDEPVPLKWEVTLYGNGGSPAEAEHVFESGAFSLDDLQEPRRLGKVFGGWYEDAACTVPFTGVTEEGGALELYAGWKEFEGYTANDEGLLTSCTDIAPLVTDGLLVLPLHDTCTGIAANAFDGVDVEITEIYIPANIHRIAPGVFDNLLSLVYIEAAPGNPYYYSEEGILYYWDGTVAAEPKG